MTNKVGIVFEVNNNIRQADGVLMPQSMPNGWYWSYDDPEGVSLCRGPFANDVAARLDMARAIAEGSEE